MTDASPARKKPPPAGAGLRRAFEQAPGFLAMLHGPDHVFAFTNQAYQQLVGHRDIIGHPLREVHTEVDDQGLLTPVGEAWRTAAPTRSDGLHMSLRRTPRKSPESRFLDFVFQPVLGPDERVEGVLVFGSDVTERVVNEMALRRTAARMREFFAGAVDAIFICDAHSRYTEVNQAACDLLGFSREELIGKPVADLMDPRDAARRDAWRKAGGPAIPSLLEWRLRHKDGSWVDVEIAVRTLPEGGDQIFARDITARKKGEEHLRLMIHELNHRVKNSLATVQAIAAQSLRGDDVSAERRDAFTGRLMALARANDVLTAENWDGAVFSRVVAQVASPHADPGDRRFITTGPELRLSPKTATALALGLHELATNAAKYGALSAPGGRVELTWEIDPKTGLSLAWRERGGPRVAEPATRGFGSRLLERGLAAELGGKVEVRYEPEGVTCLVTAPLGPDIVLADGGADA